MSFLSTATWWTFFILAALSYFVSSLGHHGRGTKSPQIEAFGSFGLIVFVIFAFVFSGWKGGIGCVVALFVWAVISERILWTIFRNLLSGSDSLDYSHFLKRSQFHTSPSKLPVSGRELLQQGNATDEMITKISSQPEIIHILLQYGKHSTDLQDIFHCLLASGSGEYVAYSVIENPQLLAEYLQMKTTGVSDLDIACKFSKSLGGS
jgi:hypothetical protein